jgi:site-specific DNA recombinase
MEMRIAIYARFSSDKQSDTSLTDQYAACERHAKAQGWKVTARYKDAAISGRTDDRPGFKQMCEDARAGKFDVLLCYDLSRIARNLKLFRQTTEDFESWGRRLVSVSDNLDSASPMFKLMSGVLGSFAEHFSDALGTRVRLAVSELAKKGLARGGRAYGYATHTLPDGTKKWRIKPEEAKIVRQIFTWFAAGEGAQQVAKRLNADKVPTPRGKIPGARNGKCAGWTASTIQGCRMFGSGLLNNTVYIGELRWNTNRWHKRRNGETDGPRLKRVPLRRDLWITTADPSLRIIDDALWRKVKARQKVQWAASETMRARQGAAARTGRKPKFLLSGLLKCDTCGGNMSIRDGKRYGCSAHFYHETCANDVTVSRALIEQKVLGAIKSLFGDDAFALFKKETSRLLAEHRKNGHTDTKAVQRQLRDIETKIGRVNTAIEDGAWGPELKSRLEELGKQRDDLEAKLRSDPKALDNVADFLPRAAERFKDAIAKLGSGIPSREMTQARQTMAALVGSEIRLKPTKGGGLSATLQGHYAGLLHLISADGWKVPNPGIPTSPR